MTFRVVIPSGHSLFSHSAPAKEGRDQEQEHEAYQGEMKWTRLLRKSVSCPESKPTFLDI